MHTEKMGQCSHCGSENVYSAVTCTGCGWRLPWADAIETARASAAQLSAQPSAQAVAQPLALSPHAPTRPDNVWVVFCGQCGSPGSSAAHFCSRCGQVMALSGGEALAHHGAAPSTAMQPAAHSPSLAMPAAEASTRPTAAIAPATAPFSFAQSHPGVPGVNVTVNTIGMQGDAGIAHRSGGGFWPAVWWMVTAPFRFLAYCLAAGLIVAGFSGMPALIFLGALLAFFLARPIFIGRD